jgi:hypothetical protein
VRVVGVLPSDDPEKFAILLVEEADWTRRAH